MSTIRDPSTPDEIDSSLTKAYYKRLWKRADEERCHTPVPCQWPDAPASAPAAAAADAKDLVQTPPVLSTDQRVEYGILHLDFKKITSDVEGLWKPRAILEHDGSYTELNLKGWPTLVSPRGWGNEGVATTHEFDISLTTQPCEAFLHLLLARHTESNQSPAEDEDAVMDLGSVNLGPFAETVTTRMETCTFKDAVVQMDMTVSFSRKHLPAMIGKSGGKWFRWSGPDLGAFELIQENDDKTFYLMATISAETYREKSANVSLDNPWVLPVKFAYKSPGRLHFLSPISSSQHLLGRAQKWPRVTDEEAQLYIAQLVCALESLHELGIVGLLSSENVLLDVFGNICIITPRLFTTDQGCGLDQLAYPAPEVLSGDVPSQLADWWILGGFLYEILTGLPPFYHQDPTVRDRKILTEELGMPTYVQGATADILRRLLEKAPSRRLGGARGVSEIKQHEFFTGVDWQRLNVRCRKLSPFQPSDVAHIFKNSSSRGSSCTKTPRKIRESGGYLHEELDFNAWGNGPNPEFVIGRLRRSSNVFNFSDIEEWTLSPDQAAAKALRADSARKGYEPEAIMARLKAAFQTNQSTEKVAHILDGCTSDTLATVLKSPILLVNDTHIGAIVPETLTCNVPITALEWTAELGRADLVLLLLDRGADPNGAFDEDYGPALIRAARERRTELVEILAPKASRITALRTLCLAVEQRDVPTITSLLSHGVPCDFIAEDEFLPPPLTSKHDWYHGEDFGQVAEPTFKLPPIVRATRHGDAVMVRLLLNHGADPNAVYHSLNSLKPEWHATWQEEELKRSWKVGSGFSCGRVVQLAMQLGHRDVVDALLEAGADIGLPYSEWPAPGHVCPLVPRSTYLRVTAGLEEAATSRVG